MNDEVRKAPASSFIILPSYFAPQRLRHKCSKTSFQVTFWFIVLLWQFVACDSLQNWAIFKAVFVQADGIRQAVQQR